MVVQKSTSKHLQSDIFYDKSGIFANVDVSMFFVNAHVHDYLQAFCLNQRLN